MTMRIGRKRVIAILQNCDVTVFFQIPLVACSSNKKIGVYIKNVKIC